MKVATVLDRPPSKFFKKWIEYNTQLFDKNNFIFINYYNSSYELKGYLENKGFNDILILNVTANKTHNINSFRAQLNELIPQAATSDKTVIFNCPVGCMIDPKWDVYWHLPYETTPLINQIQFECIVNKHTFIFLDSDEILLCNDINEILQSDFDYIVPEGYTVVQNKNESRLNWDKPIHKQRSYWVREPYFYDKPIIVKKYLEWGNGRHYHHHKDVLNINPNPNITLFHLRDICFDYLYEENQYTSNVLYFARAKDHRVNWEEEEKFSKWRLERQENLSMFTNEVRELLKKYNF